MIFRNLPTKQNLLCDNKSGLEIIRSHSNTLQDQDSNNNTRSVSRVDFVYPSVLGSSYKLLLDTSSIMGTGGRWADIRRALHRMIHLLPLGSVIRYTVHSKEESLLVSYRNILVEYLAHTLIGEALKRFTSKMLFDII